MKINFKRFVKDEDGNNLVIALIILGVVALPLVFFITGMADESKKRSGDELNTILKEDAGKKYSPGGMANYAPLAIRGGEDIVFKVPV